MGHRNKLFPGSGDRDGGDADALAIDRVFTEGVLGGGADELRPDELGSRTRRFFR